MAESGKHGAERGEARLAGLVAPIRVVIGTADPPARALIASALSAQPDVVVIASRGRGPELVAAIASHRPDLVFLDVQIAEMDAFDVIEAVGSGRMPPVVFIAAKRDLAARAFEMRALDYLLKPLSRRRVEQGLNRAREHVVRERVFAAAGRLLAGLTPQEQHEGLAERMTVRAGAHMLFVQLADIDWVESDHNHVRLHVGPKSYRVRKTIAELEAALGDQPVARIHRRVLVRLPRIRELRLTEGGRCEVVLTSGATLPVSRTYRASLKRRLGRS